MKELSEKIATAAGDSSDEMIAKREKAQRRKKKISEILKQIKKDVYEGELTKELGEEMAAEYESELIELENTLITLQTALEYAVTPESVYSYLQELLSLYGADNDELTKRIFDKLVERVIVHDDRIEVHLVVFPFAHCRDKKKRGLPHYSLSLMTTKKALRR